MTSQSRRSFTHLLENAIKNALSVEFEFFLTAPVTLYRPSLIIRGQIANQNCHIRVVTDKPISQRRLTRSFMPFLIRVLHRTFGPADFFLLLSDNLYVSQPNQSYFIEFLKNFPFLTLTHPDPTQIPS